MADKFQLKALITGVDKLSPVLSGVRKNAANLRKQLNSSGLGKITFMDAIQGGAIAAPFVMGVQAAMGFESAMADVKKVVNFDTPEQFKAMSDDVLGLSERLPMAAEGIAQIVAAGGQSGIAREELNQFAEDAVKMGVAFDQTAEQSGSMMAKWRTAFKMNQAEVVTLADQINYLGNTGAASTGQISAILTTIGPLGEVAGVSAAQLAAMGSTLAGVGIAQDVAATGIKNFMLTLTAGTAATKSQAQAYKALRLDANEISKGMQTDSEGTINRVLQTLAKVEKSKQAAVLTNLFGKESVGAIAPLLTSLNTLQKNFKSVADENEYAGSMQAEYTARAATTQNAMQLLQNRVTRLGITVGSVLLPPFNDFMATVGPIIGKVTELAGANPWLIKGIIGAAVGFTVLRLATAAATAALTLMNGVASMSPIGLVVRGIALAAGLVIANWSTLAPYFEAIWSRIQGPAMVLWGWMKTAFAWSPLGQIIANWEPISGFFGALWGLVKAFSVPFFDFLKSVFDWSPLGMIIKHWEPITGFFRSMWEKLRPIIEPMMKFLGFESEGADGAGVFGAATDKVNAWTEEQKARNAANHPAPGQLVKPIAQAPELMPAATNAASLLRAPVVEASAAPLSLLKPQPVPQPLPVSTPVAATLPGAAKWLPAAPVPPVLSTVAAAVPVPPKLSLVPKVGPPVLQSEADQQPATAQVPRGEAAKVQTPTLQVVPPKVPNPVLQVVPTNARELAQQPAPAPLLVMPQVPQLEQSKGVTPADMLKAVQGGQPLAQATRSGAVPGQLPASSSLAAARGSLVQQAAATQKTNLEGSMLVRFENAPAGMRVDQPQTNQPGLTVTPQVGYRSLRGG
ncbi:phage tail tape measure protein [Pseudomonas arcuscaelestis]|uniref:phage tail tape measure protein n=1 Tax=Pseudomonas arcuscaelestis TaxID=2710591 RepID=UPI001F2C3575|nr:phage tail tape measure protein [Pseudomonas arcuscaelestis]